MKASAGGVQLSWGELIEPVVVVWEEGYVDWFEQYDAKFAELIVQICANIVRNSSLPDSYSEDCLEDIADELEELFGVKE